MKIRLHLKHQVLFSLKKNEKYFRMSSAAVVKCAFKVKSLSPVDVAIVISNV